MEEAERVAGRIAIIDHGKIITEGTAAELKSRTQTDNLEDAFLKLTGSTIRPEEVSSGEQMRAHMRLHR
jgi:ABC-2 type transport system ATP-binding protein